jgi:Cellulase (glycosyl hydrolase family 5)
MLLWVRHAVMLVVLAVAGGSMLAAPAHAAPFAIGMQDARPISGNPSEQAASFDRMQGLGTDVTRLTLFWNMVAARCERSAARGADLSDHTHRCYSWEVIDRAVALARARGMRVLVSVYGAPAWANASADLAWTGGTQAEFDTFAAHYSAFVHAAATRYSSTSEVGSVAYWTVWNEPNGAYFWKPMNADAPRRYALLYDQAARRLKAADPAALVAPGPTAPNSPAFKPGVWIPLVQGHLEALGSAGLVDAWAHNPYPGADVSPFKTVYRLPSIGIGNIRDLFTVLDASEVTRGKPVWATEFAYQTNPPDPDKGVAPALQARWLAEALDVAWTTGRMPIFEWYILQDPMSDPALDWDSGVFAVDGSEKPAAAMYRRPVSLGELPDGRVRAWGMSTLAPESATLVSSRGGGAPFTPIPGQVRDENGVVVAIFRPTPGTVVALHDAAGTGPALPTDDASAAPSVGVPDARPGAGSARAKLVLRQRAPKARRAATCGARVQRSCIYRRGARASLQIAMTPYRRLTARVTYQRRTARGWRAATRPGLTLRARTTAVMLPSAVRRTPGVYRVQVAARTQTRAVPSRWQYLRIR